VCFIVAGGHAFLPLHFLVMPRLAEDALDGNPTPAAPVADDFAVFEAIRDPDAIAHSPVNRLDPHPDLAVLIPFRFDVAEVDRRAVGAEAKVHVHVVAMTGNCGGRSYSKYARGN
jgi:hypothetical protein